MEKGNLIAYSESSATLFTFENEVQEVENFSQPQLKNEVVISPWAPWSSAVIGSGDNQMPVDMAEKIRSCGVLSAGLEAKARIAIGKGIQPVIITGIDDDGEEILKFVNDPEIMEWFENNHAFANSIATIRNLLGYGWTHGRFILDNNGKKIARCKTDEVVKCRLGRYTKDNNTLIEKTYIAADWRQIVNLDEANDYVKVIEMLEEGNEYDDLNNRIENKTDIREFSYIIRGPLHDMVYYPRPLWYSCYNWVQMAIQVPAMKTAMMNNQMSIKYIITISEKYFSQGDKQWNHYTAEERNQKFQEKAAEINKHLSGNDKAYKSIVTSSYVDPTGKEVDYIRIQVLDDKVKDGKLLPDSSAANKEILFALMVNPTILGTNTFGGDYSGGAGSGSDIREAYLLQIMLMEAERQENEKVYNIVKKINGWDKKYPGEKLAFRYPNLILTTLDTGGSTASTIQTTGEPADTN